MSLPNLKITTSNKTLKKAFTGVLGTAEFKLHADASKRNAASILGWRNVHATDKGSIGLKQYCKECGTIGIDSITIDGENRIVERPAKPAGVLDVVGLCNVSDFEDGWFDSTYYVTPKSGAADAANLHEALYMDADWNLGLLGYIRFTSTSDERPALLYSPEAGVLSLTTLFFEDEVIAGIPAVDIEAIDTGKEKLSAAFDAECASHGFQMPASLVRREVKSLPKEIKAAIKGASNVV